MRSSTGFTGNCGSWAGWGADTTVVIVGDGAEWVWNRAAWFIRRCKILDLWHALEHPWVGYGIGSGAVESAHKQVIHARLRQAGMRWSEAGARPLAGVAPVNTCRNTRGPSSPTGTEGKSIRLKPIPWSQGAIPKSVKHTMPSSLAKFSLMPRIPTSVSTSDIHTIAACGTLGNQISKNQRLIPCTACRTNS